MTALPTGVAAGRPVRVLESFRTPRATTNPYLSLLVRSLPGEVIATTFSWRRALAGSYDVLHVHWPEVVVDRRHPARRLAAVALFSLVLLRCRVTGRALVRTAHNVAPHERQGAPTRAVLRLCDRWTTWWIRLNDTTPTPPGEPATTILHGHYRNWFTDVPRADRVPGRVLHFGLVRRYKGVEQLLEAFRRLDAADVSLHVVGRAADAEMAAGVQTAAAVDARVSLQLEHVPDEVLAREVGECELVVLPYRAMHNSGAVLLALSLGRPVLVPSNPVTDALADEVGPDWVLRYDDTLDVDVLDGALRQAKVLSGEPHRQPDLRARDWEALGRQHAEVFRAASLRARTSRPRVPGRRPAAGA